MGPKEIAKAFEMKETEMSKKGKGYVAANGSSSNNYGEKKIAGYRRRRAQCADVNKVLCSAL